MKYISDLQLAERYQVSRSSIWRWAARGRLPAPIQLSPGCTRWIAEEVDSREAELHAQRPQRKIA